MKEFDVNKYISLRLVGIKHQKTVIFVNNEGFMQCKSLLIIDPQEKITQKEINSIDQISEILDKVSSEELRPNDLGLTPEEEFWGHCSNLQAWVENDYNTNIMHSNLAFPLLQKLAEIGDIKARNKLKDAIFNMFEEKDLRRIIFILDDIYLKFLSFTEFKDLFKIFTDTTTLSKVETSIKDIPLYLEMFQSIANSSIFYSKNGKYAIGPIIPEIQTFFKKLKIIFDVKKKKLEKILSFRIYVDGKLITVRDILMKLNVIKANSCF